MMTHYYGDDCYPPHDLVEDSKPTPEKDRTVNRYTKDLEDMLRRAIEALEAGPGYASTVGIVLDEAKALLERTGYTEDF